MNHPCFCIFLCQNRDLELCIALANMMGSIDGRFVTRIDGEVRDGLVVEITPQVLYSREV